MGLRPGKMGGMDYKGKNRGIAHWPRSLRLQAVPWWSQSQARRWWTSHIGAGPRLCTLLQTELSFLQEAGPTMLPALEGGAPGWGHPHRRDWSRPSPGSTVDRRERESGEWELGRNTALCLVTDLPHHMADLLSFCEWGDGGPDGEGSLRASQPRLCGGGPSWQTSSPAQTQSARAGFAVGSPWLLGGSWIVNLGDPGWPRGSALEPDTVLPPRTVWSGAGCFPSLVPLCHLLSGLPGNAGCVSGGVN